MNSPSKSITLPCNRKLVGITLLVVGFLWIAGETTIGFVGYQHTMWIWQMKQLPPGDVVTKDEASDAMRKLSLRLKERHKIVLYPASMMLVGGLVVALSRRKKEGET
jgi:hypothetical protein